MKKITLIVVAFFLLAGVNVALIHYKAEGAVAEEREAGQNKGYIYRQAERLEEEMLPSGPYTLGRDDVVRISVRGQPDFSGDFVIGPDGKIQYTYVGDIETAGLTKEELKGVLAEKLTQYVKTPDVSIAILQYNSKAVYILGEVRSPGKYPMRGDTITLREAIIQAGLPTRNAALRRVHIIKPDPTDPTSKKVNLYAVLYKGKLKQNLTLMPGDIVVVPSTMLSSVNTMLDQLLSPAYKAAVVEDIRD